MRKFKVVENAPDYPPVGTILYEGKDEGYVHREGSPIWYRVTGIMEEVKEPEWTWYITPMGDVCRVDTYATPNWLRFRTKESAEKFAKALKETGRKEIDYAGFFIDIPENECRIIFKAKDAMFVRDLIDALNDRVK